jgi:hypothetical protein
MLTSFEVPSAWRPDARHQTLINLLQACRDAAWALDPALALTSFIMADPSSFG